MKSFNEVLRIKKKGSAQEPTPQPTQKPTPQKKSKRPHDSLKVGAVDGTDVYKSVHSTQKRDGEKKTRDHGIKDELILKKIKKVFDTGNLKPGNKTIIIYKNSKARYDMMIINEENGYITIVTFIQGREKDPEIYFTKSRQRQDRIIVESIEYPYIIVDEKYGDIDSWLDLDVIGGGSKNLDKDIKQLLDKKVSYGLSVIRRIIQTNNVKAIKLIIDIKDIDFSDNYNQMLKTAIDLDNSEATKLLLTRLKKFDGKWNVSYNINEAIKGNRTKGVDAALMNKDVFEEATKFEGWQTEGMSNYLKDFVKKTKLKRIGVFADLLD